MRPDGLLPNLLDDRLRRESVSRFLAMLSDLRHKAFSEWTARYRSSKLHPAVERAMDEAIALALAAEYLRAAGQDCTKVLVSATRNATRLNPAELAEAVAGKVGCRHLDQALMQGACTSRLPIPSAVAEQVFVNGIHEAMAQLGLAMATSTRRGSERAELRQSPCLLVKDFLDDAAWRKAEFDVIIGGPPFVRVEQLHRSDARKVHEYRQRVYYDAADTRSVSR